MIDLMIRGARLPDGRGPLDIAIHAGRIVEVGSLTHETASTLAVDGRLVAPAFVNAHVYADKAFLADEVSLYPPTFDESGFLAAHRSAAAAEAMAPDRVEARIQRLLQMAVRHGTTAMRVVVDVTPEIGLSRVERMLRLREGWARWIDVQILAYPQEGVADSPLTARLLRDALAAGADMVGGAPALDTDLDRHVDVLLELAVTHGVPVHFSLDMDLPGPIPAEQLEVWRVAGRVLRVGARRVSVGHLCALGSMEPSEAARALARIHEAGLHVLVFGSAQLYRLGRTDRRDVRRGLTRVKELLAAGVNVAYASNDIRDAFNPFGTPDMLLEGLIVALAAYLGSDEELATVFDMGTRRAADVLGLPDRAGIEAGARADLVVLDAPTVQEAIRSQAEKLYVIREGRILALNQRLTHLL